MNPILRNILAVAAGLVVGSVVNMSLILLSGSVIPPPAGADVTTSEGLRAAIHLFEPKHFVFPFMAHALGTLAGAVIATLLAATSNLRFGIGVGAFFLLGGISMAFQIPAPLWFIVLDLLVAYLPMGYLGGKWAIGKRKTT